MKSNKKQNIYVYNYYFSRKVIVEINVFKQYQ